MKIVDETTTKTVPFGSLRVGDAFERGGKVYRKCSNLTAAAISKNVVSTEDFDPRCNVIHVDYELVFSPRAKKTARFGGIPKLGVFTHSGWLWMKTEKAAILIDAPADAPVNIKLFGDFEIVELVDATLTIRDAE